MSILKPQTDLLSDFQAVVNKTEAEARDRAGAVQGRIEELENELADLRQVLRKIEAANQVA